MSFVARTVAPELTYPLRREVLRPTWELSLVGAEDASARHPLYFALFDEETGEVVSTAMVQLRPPPEDIELSKEEPARSYQLRAVATVPRLQRQGLGASLLSFVEETVVRAGGAILWCNSRLSAVSLYARFGMQSHGEPFEIAGIGTHLVMWKRLS